MTDDDEVFTGAGNDWHNRAMIGFAGGVHWYVYVDGYKVAGDRLVAGIDAGLGMQDFLVFPILHLYRHWLELSLKANIRMSQMTLGVQRPTLDEIRRDPRLRARAAQGHDLGALWKCLQTLLPEIYPDLEEIHVANMNRVVQAFNDLDPGGDQTRYPVGLKENPSLENLKAVNLCQLADDMAQAENGFKQIEGALDFLGEEQDYNQQMEDEMEAEFRSWYQD